MQNTPQPDVANIRPIADISRVHPTIVIGTTETECPHKVAEWKGTYAQCKRCGAVVNHRHQTVQEAK
jgi:hypothetical protein